MIKKNIFLVLVIFITVFIIGVEFAAIFIPGKELYAIPLIWQLPIFIYCIIKYIKAKKLSKNEKLIFGIFVNMFAGLILFYCDEE